MILLKKFILLFLLLVSLSCNKENLKIEFKVALTFDDGPDNLYTEKILDILKEKKVPATFFVLGNKVMDFPNITKRIIKDGHSIGNHTLNHLCLSNCSLNIAKKNIERTENIIDSVCGFSKKIFRPPWGKINNEVKEYLQSQGFLIYLWNIDSHDWDIENYCVSDIIINVIEEVNSDAIILFHDSDYSNKCSRMNTVKALPEIIDGLKNKGAFFVKVEDIKQD